MATRYLAEDPYEKLANAIVLQAVTDYRRALRKLRKDPKDEEAVKTIVQVEKFFRSGWYQLLTSIDGEFLLNKLREEASESN